MTDNRLRCALVYRLGRGADVESGSGVVLLAKFDHASQYETHKGARGDSATLYGGRDKSYADAVAMIISKGPPSPPKDSNKVGGFKVVKSDAHQVVYGIDHDRVCVAVITGLRYQSRVAIQMLVEFHSSFTKKFGVQIQSATVNSLSKKAKPLMAAVCKKYDDPSKVDKASALIDKVDEVKSSMQGNIAAMLANTEKAEGIAAQSEQLNEQANVFKKKSTDLKRDMRWKDMKMTIIIAALVVGILIIIIVPLVIHLT